MKHHIKLIALTWTVSVSLVGCGKILYILRTEKKCDPNNIEKSIFGGCQITAEVENKFPELTSSVLINTIYRDSFYGNICTGTFISENIILTAGHCIIKKDWADNNLPIAKIAIDNEKTVHTQYMAKTIYNPTYIVHPHYKANAKFVDDTQSYINAIQIIKKYKKANPFSTDDFADLALIYSPYSATELNAKIIRLSESVAENERVYFVGYGLMTDTDETSKIKEKKWGISYSSQSLNKDINSKKFLDKNNNQWDMNKYWNTHIVQCISDKYKTKSPAESYLVTIGHQNEEGVCSGDSGGIIFIKRNNEFLGAGVVHASSGDCSEKVSFNMKVGAYKDWILNESAKLTKTTQSIQFIP